MKSCALGLVALAALVIQADAAPILHIHDSQGNLGTIDAATGTITPIGNMGVILTDIAINPVTGDLFGINFTNLYSINPLTAVATQIGSGLDIPAGSANALTFSDDGSTLYGASEFYLFEINTATGLAFNEVLSGMSAGDLAFHAGALYMTTVSNQLVRIDNPAVGTVTPIGPVGFPNVFGLASDGTTLYGTSGQTMITINTATGAGTFLSSFAGQPIGNGSFFQTANGLTFLPEDPPPPPQTPEPSTLMLSGLAILFVVGKTYQKRKRQS